jgi:hypothetical protein
MCKQQCKIIVIVIKYENVNTKGTKQGYGTRSYFKLLLNKLKNNKGSYLHLHYSKDLAQESFHRCFHVLIDFCD